MGNYLFRRILAVVPTLLLLSVLVFLFVHGLPGDPALAILGSGASAEAVATLRANMGLDRPLVVQYFTWLSKALTGDLGYSVISGRPVSGLLLQRLPVTLTLAVGASLISLSIGLVLGVLSAVKRGRGLDMLFTVISLVFLSVPEFWAGILLILIFSLHLGWLPVAAYVPLTQDFVGGLRALLLPSVGLGLVQMAILARMARSSTLDVLHSDYVRTARAKGLKESIVVVKHVLRNALLPVVTIWRLNFGMVLGGVLAIETVFSLPGMGRFLVYSIQNRDYPVVQGALLYIALTYVLVNLLVDVLYRAIDPRIVYE